MYQLTYISTARLQNANADIDQILAVSRRNNQRDGITGLLVHDGVRFLQALEGPRREVMSAFRRIQADARHRAPVVLSEREIDDRQFGSWAMASQSVRTNAAGFTMPEIVDALVASVPDANIRALFSSFCRVDRRPAA